jgi:antitoxin PrlF
MKNSIDSPPKAIEGTVSPKYQITIPASMREAIGLRPGDKIEFKLEKANVIQLRIKRPLPSETIQSVLSKFDLSSLKTEMGTDASKAVRNTRWEDE